MYSFEFSIRRLDRHHLRRQREYSDKEILRPGFTRLNLPYFYDNTTIEFILEAVLFVAEHGWKFLPQYIFNPETGEWKQRLHQPFIDRKWLGSVRFVDGKMEYPAAADTNHASLSYEELLSTAEELVRKASKTNEKCPDQTVLFGTEGEKYRWFLLPCEAQSYLNLETPRSCIDFQMPFQPGAMVNNTVPKYENHHKSKDKMINLHFCNCSKIFSHENFSQRGISNDVTNSQLKISTSDGSQIMNYIKTVEDLREKLNAINEQSNTNEDCQNDISINNSSNAETFRTCVIPKTRTTDIGNNQLINVPSASFHNPPKAIFSPFIEAMVEFDMIHDKDRVLLCLSGGKDSLSMLHIVSQYRYYAAKKDIHFTFGAMTVDPQSSGYDPRPLKGYLKSLNVPYHYEEQDIIGAAANLPVCESICSFCSRMKRGRIYACARREGYNVIALGQHLDDVAESFLMSTFHNGYLRSMKANYTVKEGDLRVIRPLIYTREKDLRKFAEKVKLPVIPENCPACFEAPKERHRMKQLLAQQEVLFPNLFQSLRSALKPLISKDRTGMEKRIIDDTDEE